MPVTYTNRKAKTYFLCQGITKTGKPRYYFTPDPKESLLVEIPDGYQIQESVNGIVSLVRIQPSLISSEDVAAVEAALQNHPQARRYRVSVKTKYITIHEQTGMDVSELSAIVGRVLVSKSLENWETCHAQYRPIMRFLLSDADKHLFNAERFCFLGSIDDWINIEFDEPIQTLAARLIPTLGTDDFFELF